MPSQFTRVFQKSALPVLTLSVSLFVAGCGMGVSDTSVPEHAVGISGMVHGGQNPVSGATIGLWKVGTTGYASAATQILTQTVTSNSVGAFTLTNLYTCANTTDQMYITATQGNPGLGTNVNNAALTMVAALGNCGNLGANTFITINEVTTVAAAYALAQFAKDYQHIGSSSTNALGIQNAFLNASLIANYATGQTAALASNLATEGGKLYALADVLAPCVNSDGTSVCTTLFSGLFSVAGNAPVDSFTAALSIAQHPGVNISGIWGKITGTVPFVTTLTAAPHDWTMSLTVTGGGLSSPTAVRVDANGVVWAADYYGGISAVSPQGIPYSSAAYANNFSESYGLAIDTNGHVWATCEECGHSNDSNHGSIIGVNGSSSTNIGSAYLTYAGPTLNYPESMFADSNGNLDIANYASGTVTVIDQSGNVVSSGLGSGTLQFPVAVFADSTHGVWLANQESTFATHVGSDGTIIASPKCCAGADGVALDQGGNAWVANYWSSSLSEVSSAGAMLVSQAAVGGLFSPSFVGIDGAQNVWATNYHGASISEVAGSYGTPAAGTALSPSTGYGLDAALLEPFSLAIDQSGNIWVANYARNNLVMFFGLGTPTASPTQNVPTLP